jgi:hypothetical protein
MNFVFNTLFKKNDARKMDFAGGIASRAREQTPRSKQARTLRPQNSAKTPN